MYLSKPNIKKTLTFFLILSLLIPTFFVLIQITPVQAQLLYIEDFEGGTYATFWTVVDNNTGYIVEDNTQAHGGDYYFDCATGDDDEFLSEQLFETQELALMNFSAWLNFTDSMNDGEIFSLHILIGNDTYGSFAECSLVAFANVTGNFWWYSISNAISEEDLSADFQLNNTLQWVQSNIVFTSNSTGFYADFFAEDALLGSEVVTALPSVGNWTFEVTPLIANLRIDDIKLTDSSEYLYITIIEPSETYYGEGDEIPLELSVSTNGVQNVTWYNVKNSTDWVYAENQTYTIATTLTGFTQKINYQLWAWTNTTSGLEDYATKYFSVLNTSTTEPEELIVNGGFETGSLPPWSHVSGGAKTVTDTQSHSGTYSCSFDYMGFLRQNFSSPYSYSAIFNCTVWAKTVGGGTGYFDLLIYYTDTTTDSISLYATSSWSQYQGSYTSSGKYVSAVEIQFRADTGTLYIDDVSLLVYGTVLTYPDLYLQLPFDNETSSTVYDWTDFEHDGTITGASRTYSGVYGMDLQFDGTDYITIIDIDTLDISTTIALSAWVKTTNISAVQVIFDKLNAYGLYIIPEGRVSFMINNEYLYTDNNTITVNTWYHIVGEYDGSAMNIYVNEVLKTTTPYSEAILSSAFDLIIGDAFVGELDEIQIASAYSITLTNSIATYPYCYGSGLMIDTTSCSWIIASLTYNFTGIFIRENSTYPITYAKINFTDGENELGLSYDVTTTTYNCIGDENGTEKLSLVSRSYTLTGNAAVLQGRIKIEIIIQTASNVDVMLYCTTASSSDSLLIEDRFNIYGIGGVTTTTITGDGSLISGGGIFDIMAQNSSLVEGGSSIRVDTIVVNFQHLHLLTHLYQGAIWDTDHWDCPTSDNNTGYLEYGIDYVDECTNQTANNTWTTGWKVRIEIIDGDAGDHGAGSDQAWVLLKVTWFTNNTVVKSDTIYAFYEAYHETDLTTQLSLYVDLWISSDEFSSNVAGRVSSQYYGMTETGWWLWSTWGPKGSLSTSSSFSDNLYNSEGNVTTASKLKLFRVYSKIAKTDPGEGATSCDEHLWAATHEVTQIKSIPYNVELTGITTPVFMPTTTPNMPLGFFASLGNILAGALDSIYYALTAAASGVYAITAAVLDTVFGAFGISGFTVSMTSYIGGFATYFVTSITYITSLIVSFFTLLASIAMFIIEWFGHFVNAFIAIGNGIASVLTGGMLDPFSQSILTSLWNSIGELIVSGGLFTILIIYWFNSIDQRAKRLGGGWMSILMGDINSIISVLSFILDLAWRVVNTVIDLAMRFINVFI